MCYVNVVLWCHVLFVHVILSSVICRSGYLTVSPIGTVNSRSTRKLNGNETSARKVYRTWNSSFIDVGIFNRNDNNKPPTVSRRLGKTLGAEDRETAMKEAGNYPKALSLGIDLKGGRGASECRACPHVTHVPATLLSHTFLSTFVDFYKLQKMSTVYFSIKKIICPFRKICKWTCRRYIVD